MLFPSPQHQFRHRTRHPRLPGGAGSGGSRGASPPANLSRPSGTFPRARRAGPKARPQASRGQCPRSGPPRDSALKGRPNVGRPFRAVPSPVGTQGVALGWPVCAPLVLPPPGHLWREKNCVSFWSAPVPWRFRAGCRARAGFGVARRSPKSARALAHSKTSRPFRTFPPALTASPPDAGRAWSAVIVWTREVATKQIDTACDPKGEDEEPR